MVAHDLFCLLNIEYIPKIFVFTCALVCKSQLPPLLLSYLRVSGLQKCTSADKGNDRGQIHCLLFLASNLFPVAVVLYLWPSQLLIQSNIFFKSVNYECKISTWIRSCIKHLSSGTSIIHCHPWCGTIMIAHKKEGVIKALCILKDNWDWENLLPDSTWLTPVHFGEALAIAGIPS